MKFTSDPPPLRTLSLPTELARALETLPDEDASPAELERLAMSVRHRTALEHVSRPAGRVAMRRQWWRPRTAVFHGTLGVGMMFALGAGAGVLVANGVFFGLRVNPWAAPARIAGSADPARPVPAVNPRLSPALERTEATAGSGAATPLLAPSGVMSPKLETSAPAPARSDPGAGRADEFALLGRAQAALESDAGRALALTSDHERKFPSGALLQEREVIAIDALLRLGRRAQALARAEHFNRRFPASVHRRRVEVLLGAGGAPAGDHN
jgi:hypothetical protein